MSDSQDSEIKEKLKELAEVSRDLDRHSQLSKSASHPIQAQQVRKRIDELTQQQTSLMKSLVDRHPDADKRAQYEQLGAQVEGLKEKIRGCEEKENLVELESQIESVVDAWIHCFQVICSELSGVKPPEQAVYDS